MSQLAFTNAKILIGGCDLSADSNQVTVAVSAKMLNNTVFGMTAESNRAGIVTSKVDIAGFWDIVATGNPDGLDNTIFAALGTNDQLLTVFANGYTEGTSTDKGISLLTTLASYDAIDGKHGDLLGFKSSIQCRGLPLRSVPLKDATAAMITATGNGTKYQVGAVGATQFLYAGLHVLAYQGTSPTLAVTIQSDADASAGGESTRITFNTVNGATGAQYATPVAGSITDTFWRATYTIGGSATPGFRFLVWMAIV